MNKSNTLKMVPYPDEFTDEDKATYDKLYNDAKILHTEIEKENPFIIHLAIIAHIRANNGYGEPFTNEELEELKNSYKITQKEFKCEVDENHYIYDKENNPMYFPSKLIISSDENNSNVVIEQEGAK